LLAIKQCSREALEELRGVVGVLRGADGDAPVEPTPDLGALDRLVADARRQGLGVDFTMPAEPTEAVPAAIQLAAFRIVEESLTNVRRHAGSAATTVAIGIEPQRICVRVRNAAAVTDPHDSETGAGVGILGMRERAQGVGGWLTAGPLPGGGYEVAAELPYRRSP
jgi:signal transduction histidine kinase